MHSQQYALLAKVPELPTVVYFQQKIIDVEMVKRGQKTFKTSPDLWFMYLKRCVSDTIQLSGTVLIPYIFSRKAYYKADEVFSITDLKPNNGILTFDS